MSEPKSAPETPWMTARQIADYLQLNYGTVVDALKSGEMRGYQTGGQTGRWRARIEDVEAWMRGERTTAEPTSRR